MGGAVRAGAGVGFNSESGNVADETFNHASVNTNIEVTSRQRKRKQTANILQSACKRAATPLLLQRNGRNKYARIMACQVDTRRFVVYV